MSEKVQISKEQAREMCKVDGIVHEGIVISQWQEAGYIKQTTLEEVRAWAQEMMNHPQLTDGYKAGIQASATKYETAISEMENKK